MPRPFFKINKNTIDEIIRVDHAGEFGAQRIYEGQIQYTKNGEQRRLIKHMLDQEQEHLNYFVDRINYGNVRPTIFLPIWSFGGYFIGAISAHIGPRMAMLVTDRVEEVIVDHYSKQIDLLEEVDPENTMINDLKKFKQEEEEHQHIAINCDSRSVIFAPIFTKIVHNMCRVAIFLSKKL